MRLAKWRIEKGFTQRQLADELGCSQPTISFMERVDGADCYLPGRELMLRIFRLTHGDVTPNDFYDLPSLDQLELPIADPAPAPLLQNLDAARSGEIVLAGDGELADVDDREAEDAAQEAQR